MKRLLVALALVGTLAVQAANERLETIRTAVAGLVELAGPEALANNTDADGLFISCSKAGPFAKGDPSEQTEDPEIAADASAPAAVDVSSPNVSVRAKGKLLAASPMTRASWMPPSPVTSEVRSPAAARVIRSASSLNGAEICSAVFRDFLTINHTHAPAAAARSSNSQ